MNQPWDPIANMPDLRGKVAVITGANSGIGLHTFKHLAAKHAKVYFTARSEAKAQSAKTFVLSQVPDAVADDLVWLPMDLGVVDSVVRAVAKLKTMEQKVDILINNAGLGMVNFETTDAGWESVMAICHVGHFLFTNGLLPLLQTAAAAASSDVRVVTLSSSAVNMLIPPNYPFDFTSSPSLLYGKIPYQPWKYRHVHQHFFHVDMFRYSIAKLANMMFAQELQAVFDRRGLPIISVSVDPGGVKTDGAIGIFPWFIKPIMRRAMLTEDQGSYTSLFAATSKEVRERPEEYKGKYMMPFGKVSPPHPVTKDEKQVQGLWKQTTEELNTYLQKQGHAPLLEW